MQERKQIIISNQILGLLVTNLNGSLDKLMIELQNDPQAGICEFLSRYHFTNRGTVYSFEIEENTLSLDASGVGSYSATYIVNYYEGCKDRDYNDDNSNLSLGIIFSPLDSLQVYLQLN